MALPKWMLEDMALTEDEQKVLDPLMTADRIKALEAGRLRQADYSKQMNGLREEQDKLAAANERLNGELAAWAQTQADGGELTKKQQQALEKAEQNVLKLTQSVRSLATAAGQDPEKVLEGITVATPTPTPTPAPAAVNPDDFLPRDAGGRLAALALTLPTELNVLAHEHHELTGEWLDPRPLAQTILERINTPGNKKSTDVRVVWEETHGIAEKRTVKAKTDHDAEIAAAEKRGRDAALSDVNLPGPHTAPGRPQSPVMQRFSGPQHKSAIDRPGPGQTVAAAVSAFRTGKYRTGAVAPVAK